MTWVFGSEDESAELLISMIAVLLWFEQHLMRVKERRTRSFRGLIDGSSPWKVCTHREFRIGPVSEKGAAERFWRRSSTAISI